MIRPSHIWYGVPPRLLQHSTFIGAFMTMSYWREYCSSMHGEVLQREGVRNGHNRTRSDSRNTILRRSSRYVYVSTWAATPSYLCVRSARSLREDLLPISEVPCRKIFRRISLQQADQQCCCR